MFAKILSVSDTKYSLSDYVRAELNKKNLTYRDVADRTGGLISHSAVYDILNGRSKNPKTDTLKALAKGLGVSEEELFAIARGKEISEDAKLKNRFELISLKFGGIKSTTKKARAEVLIDVLERELEKMANDPDE